MITTEVPENHRVEKNENDKGYGWFETVKSFFKSILLSKLKSME
jgi:hypothetical protein